MFMGTWFLVPAAILVAILVAAVAAGSPRSANDRSEAVDILDRRLASGELTVEEHAERRGVLMQAKADATRRPAWVGPITVIVLVVVVAIAAATSAGSWRGPHGGGWMGGHMGTGGSSGASAQTVADGRTVEVEAGDLWFAPETIEVVAEQPVNVTLDNTGRMFHDLTVPAADLVISAEAGDQVSGGLTMTEPGTYEFLCSVPGHAQAGMRGTIVVTEG
jgi:uncharacterized cupredoxin-like copper-binding protein